MTTRTGGYVTIFPFPGVLLSGGVECPAARLYGCCPAERLVALLPLSGDVTCRAKPPVATVRQSGPLLLWQPAGLVAIMHSSEATQQSSPSLLRCPAAERPGGSHEHSSTFFLYVG